MFHPIAGSTLEDEEEEEEEEEEKEEEDDDDDDDEDDAGVEETALAFRTKSFFPLSFFLVPGCVTCSVPL
jgi:CO dehydrogenase/acetyl-CoA synthase beta subunit